MFLQYKHAGRFWGRGCTPIFTGHWKPCKFPLGWQAIPALASQLAGWVAILNLQPISNSPSELESRLFSTPATFLHCVHV